MVGRINQQDSFHKMIDFNNAESIDRAAKEFVSSHDLLKVDFSGYRKCHIGNDNDIAKHNQR